MDVNVKGTFLVTRDVSAIMAKQEARLYDAASPERGSTRGSIVVMGSAASFAAQPNMVQYTTSKHAVLGLVKNAGPYSIQRARTYQKAKSARANARYSWIVQLWTTQAMVSGLTACVHHGLILRW
jgi:NAD(P)-dependent dehydrogenase (short-subunit alcohol dehydrogenase family)